MGEASGRDGMLCLHAAAIVHGREYPFAIIVDSGCSRSCIPYKSARRIGVQWGPRSGGMYYVTVADGRSHAIRHDAGLTLRIGTYQITMRVDMQPGDLGGDDMLLGMDWLTKVNPKVNFRPLSLKVKDHRGNEHELMGRTRTKRGRGGHCENRGHGPGHGHELSELVPVYRRTIHEGKPEIGEDGAQWVGWTILFPERKWLQNASKTIDSENEKMMKLERSLKEHTKR